MITAARPALTSDTLQKGLAHTVFVQRVYQQFLMKTASDQENTIVNSDKGEFKDFKNFQSTAIKGLIFIS